MKFWAVYDKQRNEIRKDLTSEESKESLFILYGDTLMRMAEDGNGDYSDYELKNITYEQLYRDFGYEIVEISESDYDEFNKPDPRLFKRN